MYACLLCAFDLHCSAGDASAVDAYVVRFGARAGGGGCNILFWQSAVLFYNQQSIPVEVRVIGISNGTPTFTTPDTIALPPRQVVALESVLKGAWIPVVPNPEYVLWTMHLDIPFGVQVESRDEVYVSNGCLAHLNSLSLGRVSLPVFKALTAANVPQVHLGTDLGQKDSRTNVGIYNAGTAPATARIELRRTCDDAVVDQRTVTIPGNTTVQVGALQRGSDDCTITSGFYWMRYTVVTVDQPSLSFVSNVTENQATIYDEFAPRIDLSVAHNTQF